MGANYRCPCDYSSDTKEQNERHMGECEIAQVYLERDRLVLQVGELKEELQHQKELWVVALPQLHALDDRAGIIRFGQLHDPQGSIDKTLAQKPLRDDLPICGACQAFGTLCDHHKPRAIEKRNDECGPDHVCPKCIGQGVKRKCECGADFTPEGHACGYWNERR